VLKLNALVVEAEAVSQPDEGLVDDKNSAAVTHVFGAVHCLISLFSCPPHFRTGFQMSSYWNM